MYIPDDIVDIIIEKSTIVNAEHIMKTQVLPELLEYVPYFTRTRCPQCTIENMTCIYCAHNDDYASGPGYYYGKRYICENMFLDDSEYYLQKIHEWVNDRDIDYMIDGDVNEEMYPMLLKYNVEKYITGTISHILFNGRLKGIDNQTLLNMIDLYNVYEPQDRITDEINIKLYCSRNSIENKDIIIHHWISSCYL